MMDGGISRGLRRAGGGVLVLTSALVLAAGCGGGGPSPTAPASGTPVWPGPCVTAVALDASTVALRGGTTTLSVTTLRPDCAWQVSGPEWVTFVGPMTGVGDGHVIIKALSTTDARTADLMVGGQTARWSQEAAPLTMTATCRTSEVGVFGGPCNAVVERAERPMSTGLKVTADLAQFGAPYRDDWDLVYCGCGAWDMDLRIREPFPPGTYTVRFHARDAEGRTATTTAPLVVR